MSDELNRLVDRALTNCLRGGQSVDNAALLVLESMTEEQKLGFAFQALVTRSAEIHRETWEKPVDSLV